MYCEKCGHHVEEADTCPQCGAEVHTIDDTNENSEFMQAIEELKKGKQEAFATVYDHTYKYVYSRARMLFSDDQEIMDVVQEVYISVYRNIHTLQSNESVFAWLRTITFHAGSRIVKKKKNEVLLTEDDEAWLESLPDEDTEIEDDYINKEDIEIIRDCISRLSEEHRSVILAYYYDNLKVNEISELLSISPGTVKSRLFSARSKLKGYIEEQEKKRGYKLHSFGAVALLLALRALLQQNMVVTESQSAATYDSICSELGMPVQTVIDMNASANPGVSKRIGKSLLKKVAEAGAKKVVLSTVGAVAAAAVAVSGTFAVLNSLKKTEEDTSAQSTSSRGIANEVTEDAENNQQSTVDLESATAVTTTTATTIKKPTTTSKKSATTTTKNAAIDTEDFSSEEPVIELYTITTHHGATGFFHEVMENVDNAFESELVLSLGLAKDLSNVYGYETEYINTDTGNRIRFITVGKNDNFKRKVEEIREELRIVYEMPEGTSPIIHAIVKDPKGLTEKNQFQTEGQNYEHKYGSVSRAANGKDSDYWVWRNAYYVWEKGDFDDSFGGGHWKLMSSELRGTLLDYDYLEFDEFLGGMTNEPQRIGKYDGEVIHYFAAVYMDTATDAYINPNCPSYGTVVTEDPRYIYTGGVWGWKGYAQVWEWNDDINSEGSWNVVQETYHFFQGEQTDASFDEVYKYAKAYVSQPERNGLFIGEQVYRIAWVWLGE